MQTCSECDRPATARGLCHRHYERLRRQKRLDEAPVTYPMDDRSGPRNPNWTGSSKYSAVHMALQRWLKTNTCEECGKKGSTDWAFQRWPEPLTRERGDYRELCRRCHQAFDVSTGERNYDHLKRRKGV